MQRKVVLWIDDEIEFLRSHIMFLETRGYSVTPVFSGDDGLHLLREDLERFDIVLVDEQMPGKDGLTVLSEIKEMIPDMPVVMVTKSEEEELMEKAIGRKIDGYLTKPVNPSQVLIVCKNLLESESLISEEAKHSFVRSYSEIQTRLKRPLDYKAWVKLYQGLVKRELAIEDVDDESIRQGHSGQKNEANSSFANFVISKYPDWLAGAEGKPLLSHEVLDKFLKPQIKSGEKVAFITLDSIRLDQYVMIQRLLRKHFQVSNYFYFSMMPTAKEFALPSLLSGLTPKDLSEQHGELWDIVQSGGVVWKELMQISLEKYGVKPDDFSFYDLQNSSVTAEDVTEDINKKSKFTAYHADFLDLFFGGHDKTDAFRELASNPKAFRKMTSTWFEESRLFEIMRRLSSEDVTIVLTPSSGNVFCTRGTEYFGAAASKTNLRYRYGEEITCDERYSFLLTDPSRFGLPTDSDNHQCVVLKENYHFVEHGTYHDYNDNYKNSFERGGISLEEMIMPLAILKPKVLNLDLDF
jgi:CheY-like chemotaxis protein